MGQVPGQYYLDGDQGVRFEENQTLGAAVSAPRTIRYVVAIAHYNINKICVYVVLCIICNDVYIHI